MIETREATEDDLFRIAELSSALMAHIGKAAWSPGKLLRHVRRRFANPRYIHLVAVDGGKVIGFAGAEIRSKHTAYLMKGYVEVSHRRRGVMRQLERKLVEVLCEKGISKIDLKVESSNREGRATWIALGYETIRETMRKRI